MATLLLVRHAPHEVLGRVLCGRMPGIRISAEGRAQAARLGTYLARQSPTALLTSPQERCRETAEEIASACHLPVLVSEAFDEIDFGAWTGREFDHLAGDSSWALWNRHRDGAEPPGGESMNHAQARAVAQIRRVQADSPDGVVIAVSHADVIKAVLMWCLGLTLDAYARFDIDPASISTLHLWDNGGKVVRMNEGVA